LSAQVTCPLNDCIDMLRLPISMLHVLAMLPLLPFGSGRYDEDIASKYVWIAQITGDSVENISKWTGGIAYDHVAEVSNVSLSRYGFPFDTLGVVANYDTDSEHDCLLAFRGSKDLENYLLVDGNAVMVAPYDSCPTCKVHVGFLRVLGESQGEDAC